MATITGSLMQVVLLHNTAYDFCQYPTDEAYWAAREVTDANSYFLYEDLMQTFSDLHKSEHGIRPRWFMSISDLEQWIDDYDKRHPLPQ